MEDSRWQYCIDHYDDDAFTFFSKHFEEKHRKCLFIGGAGFDPRSTIVLSRLSEELEQRLFAVLIKEERPDPNLDLVARAENSLSKIGAFNCGKKVLPINIFADDNAVVGGINISKEIEEVSLDGFTDIIIDLSALSIGVSFPIVASLFHRTRKSNLQINVHLAVISNSNLDALISSSFNDRVTDIRGFSIPNLLGQREKAKLWLPMISKGKNNILDKIHKDIQPHDTCPIFPFPSEESPKKADELALKYISELENDWSVDPRNFVYADERKPLDIYRTILRIYRERRAVFETFGGSTIILSPLGSRMPATGMLIAALECQFPVVYVEALEYYVDWQQVDSLDLSSFNTTHIWLYGEAYYEDTQKWRKSKNS